jgi:hypothetical protein
MARLSSECGDRPCFRFPLQADVCRKLSSNFDRDLRAAMLGIPWREVNALGGRYYGDGKSDPPAVFGLGKVIAGCCAAPVPG